MTTPSDGNGPAWQARAQAVLLRFSGILLALLAFAVLLHALQPPPRPAPVTLPGGFTFAPEPVLVAVTLATAAAVGAVASRIQWVSYFAFKRKTFDPLTIPYHVAVVLQAPLIALVVLGLGAVAGLEPGVNVATLAIMFALGYFAEETWDIFHGRFRAFLGKEPHGLSAQPWVEGVDVPVGMLLPAVDLGGRTREDAQGRLRRAGVAYSHEVLAYAQNGRLRDLAKRSGLSEGEIERIAAAAEAAQRGEVLQRAVEDAVRAAPLRPLR